MPDSLIELLENDKVAGPESLLCCGERYNEGLNSAIAIARQHQAEQPQEVVERVQISLAECYWKNFINRMLPTNRIVEKYSSPEQFANAWAEDFEGLAKAAIAAMRHPNDKNVADIGQEPEQQHFSSEISVKKILSNEEAAEIDAHWKVATWSEKLPWYNAMASRPRGLRGAYAEELLGIANLFAENGVNATLTEPVAVSLNDIIIEATGRQWKSSRELIRNTLVAAGVKYVD